MKKLLLTSIVVLCFAVAHGQTVQRDTGNGYIHSQLLTHYTQEFYPPSNGKGFGFNSGINIIVPISRRISIRTGINYCERNMKYENSYFVIPYYRHDANGNHESLYCDSYELSYYQLPLYLQFNLLQKNKMNVYILSGIKTNIIKQEILSGITVSGFEGSRTTTDAYRYINTFVPPSYLYASHYWIIGSGINYLLGKNFLIGIEVGLNLSNYKYILPLPSKSSIINTGINFSYMLNTKK